MARYLAYLAGGATLLGELEVEECLPQLRALARSESWPYRPGLKRERYHSSDPWEADVRAAQAYCKRLLAGVREEDLYAAWRHLGFIAWGGAWWCEDAPTLAGERAQRQDDREHRQECREQQQKQRREQALKEQRQEEQRQQEQQRYQAEARLRAMPLADERVQ